MTRADHPATPVRPARPVLEVSGLSLRLRTPGGAAPVVTDVSFQVNPGQILGVVGESGSGKSLTALSVMRMLPAAVTVDSGTVSYLGQDLLTMPEREITALRGDRIGMVFQDPMAYLNPLMTVGAQIREVLRLHGMGRKAATARAVELLDLVGVRDPGKRVEDYPHQFSGGMRQRVVIAIAVANNPTLLIADEPTTALDVTVQAGILELLGRLRDELGTALLLITHDIGVVEDVCDSIMVMYAGRAVEQGAAAAVLGDPRHPYTRELMRSTPRLDVPVLRRLPAIPGQPPDVTRRPGGCPFHPRCPLAFDRCSEEMPPARDTGAGHRAACWLSAEPLPAPAVSTAPVREARHDDERTPILDVADARITYGRPSPLRRTPPRIIVDGVSLKAYPGRTLGLVGESGSGKSTLARTIVGLVPLLSGRISIDGMQWTDRDRRAELRRTVQMVFQDPYQSLNPRQTIETLLTEPLTVHRLVPREGRARRVAELMSLVGLPQSLLERYPYQLSGGQRQRVGIARALAVEPRLIVADEPVSALDVSVQAQIINLLADLRDELGLSYVVIAHDLSVVRHLCEDVAVMQAGVIVEQGPAERVFADPRHEYTRALLAASPGSREQVVS
ncbi:ABC transporter ATP-binding protein [Dactylosporangium roseum]|uniref:ABC transporter ATP-binding protein n=1 Tax=Dactylosporangium roseum TaxID=47989 RepID=A0ABY5Z0Z9_9ACTN|nr:ABC transporter ATP-binding protein [Dactylosporangium roseum]UWZ34725.1 ABC transporter ATP-binding protein [Dactylosporangium roseum]